MEPKQLGGYQLKGVLGEGGMGTVYRAYDQTLDRPAAVKVIRAKALSKEGRQRFLREARACSKINHPNIITVYAAGEENDTPYMAMEFVEGRTLREVINEGAVDWRTATRWITSVLDALERLHAEGIVHRDLKPENIMITSDGMVKLMDFGLAHLEAQTALTEEGAMLGTVPYMSPEQVVGRSADARSDLFSVAIIYHEMVTGQHPFRGEHPMAVMYSIRNETPKPIRMHSQDYPTGLQAVIDKAFEKDLDKRFQSATDFRDELRGLLPEGGATPSASSDDRKRFGRGAMGIVGAGVVVAVALIVWQVALNREQSDRDLAWNLNQAGAQLEEAGKFAEAEVKYREAIDADPTFSLPWNNMGMLAYKEGELEDADRLFTNALEIDPSYSAALFNMGNLKADQGELETAVSFFNRAIAADSSKAIFYNNLGALYLDLDDPASAASALDLGLRRSRAAVARAGSKETRNVAELVLSRMTVKRARAALALGDEPLARSLVSGLTTVSPEDSVFVEQLGR